jgi:hypothetical protein
MCVVWCASSSSARWLMREIQSSDSVAASRNPRARSIAVNPAVMAFVMEKRAGSDPTSKLSVKEMRAAMMVIDTGTAHVTNRYYY